MSGNTTIKSSPPSDLGEEEPFEDIPPTQMPLVCPPLPSPRVTPAVPLLPQPHVHYTPGPHPCCPGPPPMQQPYRNSYYTPYGYGAANNEFRRKRATYSSKELDILEKAYKKDPYPGLPERIRLATSLGLSGELQLKVWFQNRRAKERREGGKESTPKNLRPVYRAPRITVQDVQKRKLAREVKEEEEEPDIEEKKPVRRSTTAIKRQEEQEDKENCSEEEEEEEEDTGSESSESHSDSEEYRLHKREQRKRRMKEERERLAKRQREQIEKVKERKRQEEKKEKERKIQKERIKAIAKQKQEQERKRKEEEREKQAEERLKKEKREEELAAAKHNRKYGESLKSKDVGHLFRVVKLFQPKMEEYEKAKEQDNEMAEVLLKTKGKVSCE